MSFMTSVSHGSAILCWSDFRKRISARRVRAINRPVPRRTKWSAGWYARAICSNSWIAGIELQRTLDPLRHPKRSMVFPISADHLYAQRKALFAEACRKRYGGNAEQGPGRAIFRVAGIAQPFRCLPRGWEGQHG